MVSSDISGRLYRDSDKISVFRLKSDGVFSPIGKDYSDLAPHPKTRTRLPCLPDILQSGERSEGASKSFDRSRHLDKQAPLLTGYGISGGEATLTWKSREAREWSEDRGLWFPLCFRTILDLTQLSQRARLKSSPSAPILLLRAAALEVELELRAFWMASLCSVEHCTLPIATLCCTRLQLFAFRVPSLDHDACV